MTANFVAKQLEYVIWLLIIMCKTIDLLDSIYFRQYNSGDSIRDTKEMGETR